jgi:8-oxo-dGTP diphosphatase
MDQGAIAQATIPVDTGSCAGALLLAAAIVVHSGRVLLVRRSMTERFLPGVWGVPCGKAEPDEQPHRAAIRELWEETGLEGKVVRQVGCSEFSSVWRGKHVRNVQSNFLVHLTGAPGPIRLPLPDQEARWVLAEAVEYVMGLDEYNLAVIRQWLVPELMRS